METSEDLKQEYEVEIRPTAILARRLELANQIASHTGQEEALTVIGFSSLCKQLLNQIREDCKSTATQNRPPSFSSTPIQLQQRDIYTFFFKIKVCFPILPTSKCGEFYFIFLLLLRSSWHVSGKRKSAFDTSLKCQGVGFSSRLRAKKTLTLIKRMLLFIFLSLKKKKKMILKYWKTRVEKVGFSTLKNIVFSF